MVTKLVCLVADRKTLHDDFQYIILMQTQCFSGKKFFPCRGFFLSPSVNPVNVVLEFYT
jgi:hypothetical protein